MSTAFYALYFTAIVGAYLTLISKGSITFIDSEKDAQMCLYHVSWESNFGFCCELDEECAKELEGRYS